jgi:chemotaxis protein MotA
MLPLIGIILVFAAVFGGFLVERGNPYVLLQPAELLIIGGAAVGIILVSNPPAVIRKMLRGIVHAFAGPKRGRDSFLRHLRMLYEIFVYCQRAGGVVQLEDDVENPEQSRIFRNHPEFLRDRGTLDFICDSLRMLVIGVTTPRELDQLMELDIEVQRRGRHEPVNALASVAEALPGLGIVAAVLGVVITMGALGAAPETIGEKVAAALVGTFLGILLCYGVVGPVAARLESLTEMHAQFQHVIRIAMVSWARGASPILAIEYARRSIPPELRPTFVDMETAIKRDAVIPPVPQPERTGEVAGVVA